MAKLKIATDTIVVGGKTIRPGQTYDPKGLVKGETPKKDAKS